jgi:hypothetical protein
LIPQVLEPAAYLIAFAEVVTPSFKNELASVLLHNELLDQFGPVDRPFERP